MICAATDVCRFDEQTSKCLMWPEFELNDWLFDMDRPTDIERMVPTVLSLARDPDAAKEIAAQARETVAAIQERMVGRLRVATT